MSDYFWCHGPQCHTYKTQDRVQGSKGSKVLRTRKIKQNTDRSWYNPDSIFNYFCSQNCIYNFWNANAERVIALVPRNEPLETRIEDPTKEKVTTNWGHTYYNHTIKKIDTSME